MPLSWLHGELVKKEEITNLSAAGMKYIAVTGESDDWCVMTGPSGWSDNEIIYRGKFLADEEVAKALFPEFARTGRRYERV